MFPKRKNDIDEYYDKKVIEMRQLIIEKYPSAIITQEEI